MTVLDRYFELADRATTDEAVLPELIDLFAECAEVIPAGADAVQGREDIARLFRQFVGTYDRLQRVWKTRVTANGIEATWAIAGWDRQGRPIALQGIHVARLDDLGKIRWMQVRLMAESVAIAAAKAA